MRYIANIITKSKKYKFNELINVKSSIDELDISVPTLIIGTDMAKKHLGENINYIKRDVGDNVFWTYMVTEKRSENEKDVEKFKMHVLDCLERKITYQYFNILTAELSEIKKFIDFLKDEKEKFFFFTNKMLYVSFDDNVIGISLEECEYLGIKKRKIANRIKNEFKHVTSDKIFSTEIDISFFKNNNIILSAMFCYLNT